VRYLLMVTPPNRNGPPAGPGTASKLRPIRIVVLVVVMIAVTFVGGCLALAVVAGVLNYHEDASESERAASDPVLQRPLSSLTGRILFTAQRDATDDLYLVNVDGSGLTRVTHNPSGTLVANIPLSPDRSRIAFSTDRAMRIVPVDRPSESIPLERPAGWPAWSPDGRQLASLSLDAQRRFHLFVFNADGTGEARDLAVSWPSPTPGDRQWVGNLTWSPDGRRLAFIEQTSPGFKRSGPYRSHLYIVSIDRNELKNVSEDPNALWVDGGLMWAPDGKRLAFNTGRGVGIVDGDLNWSEIRIAPHESRAAQRPSWSPDGTRLVWFSPDSIVTSDPRGGQQQELTRGRCRGVHPSYSADGLRIAFVCNNVRSELFVMNADGSGLTKVTTLDPDQTWLDRGATLRDPIWLAER